MKQDYFIHVQVYLVKAWAKNKTLSFHKICSANKQCLIVFMYLVIVDKLYCFAKTKLVSGSTTKKTTKRKEKVIKNNYH